MKTFLCGNVSSANYSYAVKKVLNKGANAVLGVDSESSFGSNAMRAAVSGTAVKIKKLDSFITKIKRISKSPCKNKKIPIDLLSGLCYNK